MPAARADRLHRALALDVLAIELAPRGALGIYKRAWTSDSRQRPRNASLATAL
jgi:hypothetical protein